MKADFGRAHRRQGHRQFALNILGKDHKGLAFTFFKPAKLEDGKLSGQEFHAGANGAPILDAAIAAVELSVRQIVELGDHHIVVAEVTEAYVKEPADGPRRCSDPGDEGSRRHGLLRRLGGGFGGAIRCAPAGRPPVLYFFNLVLKWH